jgi:hypothetical protein
MRQGPKGAKLGSQFGMPFFVGGMGFLCLMNAVDVITFRPLVLFGVLS